MKTKMFSLVAVVLLHRGVAYAYNPSVSILILKVEGIEQDIPPPRVPPLPLPTQVFLHVGEIADILYPMFGSMVQGYDNPSEGIEQEESYVLGPMTILRIKGVTAGRYQVNMKWHNPLNPRQPPLGRQTIQIIVQP